ncbi:phosphatidylserine decarboxylase [Lactobacillus crispatus]|uniref:Phosphatidylserine decarboxylase n=1 Tax=Lactobacillus crispatus TaxID=47770 RepID=A0AAW8WNG5_9LACO|nr:phosphatidylserine decarboxylase [Lactobacillus crispatus]MBW0438084.1 phosphatidylserine decarboxylase [Lactobacillus crispatus]MBW0443606.1 phosphatidylserine decarboxylase [Lactobacillus crispatus]MBW0456792.1 phosphatidylserine decarboxylase [Lactobacillus crispatus]MDK6665741.1 phosphatidylserine decarboxylase [Lactobacillus crispatus]MDK8612322.1 phosphatidylserine decarboxylase [Lactobacillus crispatus]
MLIRQKSVKAKLKKLTYHDGDFIIPAGYELVSMLPTSYKFKASDNDPIDIHLKHKVIVITPNGPKQSTDKLPDNPSKNYLTGVSQNDLNEMIKRQITVVRPDGSTIDASQLITLTRTATLDEVTGKVIKYSNWTIGSFSEYNAPEIQGYTPNRNAKAVEVVKHGDDHFEPIKITYISLGSDTDDTKTGDYPGNTSTTSQSNSKEVEHVPLKNKFWIKGQPYSLLDLLHNDPWTSKFEGGTIYQAFLSALSYHRWNSPVSGKIVKAYHINGSYYGEALSQGFENPNGAAPVAANDSQAFLTSTATRAVIFIQADNPRIGLMCFVAVGMGDVSNNEITVRIGQHVKKGEQLGMFHFGGSTHVLLFQPTVDLDFNLHGQKPGIDSSNIKVRDEIAVVK